VVKRGVMVDGVYKYYKNFTFRSKRNDYIIFYILYYIIITLIVETIWNIIIMYWET